MIKKDASIIVTGAAGFIGSYMTGYLNNKGLENLILADEFDEEEKELNLHKKKFKVRVERDDLFEWLEKENPAIDFIFHLGARTDISHLSRVAQHEGSSPQRREGAKGAEPCDGQADLLADRPRRLRQSGRHDPGKPSGRL